MECVSCSSFGWRQRHTCVHAKYVRVIPAAPRRHIQKQRSAHSSPHVYGAGTLFWGGGREVLGLTHARKELVLLWLRFFFFLFGSASIRQSRIRCELEFEDAAFVDFCFLFFFFFLQTRGNAGRRFKPDLISGVSIY